jgi:hypothetical protein
MYDAYNDKDFFYKEYPTEHVMRMKSAHRKKPVSAKIVIVIDHACGSACLDFIDEMMSLDTGLTLGGEATAADSLYMEKREASLPSQRGTFIFPIKVYRGRALGYNVHYVPHITVTDVQDTKSVQNRVRALFSS